MKTDYTKYATHLLIASAVIYILEKIIIMIPEYIDRVRGSYTTPLPTVSIFENKLVVAMILISLVFYGIDLYKNFETQIKNLKKNKTVEETQQFF